jgi:hypothetical protein
MTESQIHEVKRLRQRLHTWDEIAAKLGLPRTSCYRALRGHTKSKATLRREARAIQRREEIRRLRAKIQWLERKLEERTAGILA